MRVAEFEAMARRNGFERAAMHVIGSLLEERAADKVTLKQLDEYLKKQTEIITKLTEICSVLVNDVDGLATLNHGSILRMRQVSLGVKVESEAVQGAEAGGVNASGSV